MTSRTMDRRTAIGLIAGATAWPLLPASAAPRLGYVMWRDPNCGCCLAWAKRVEAAFGKKLPVVDSPNMPAVKKAQGVPTPLHSCHTAIIQGVVVEGHVPIEDIKRVIASGRRGVMGLAVPGMPAGSPGMDVGSRRERYQVFSFDAAGHWSPFATHG